jgi:hypothetical protein
MMHAEAIHRDGTTGVNGAVIHCTRLGIAQVLVEQLECVSDRLAQCGLLRIRLLP